MAVLLALAYVVGWVVRFNIIHVENHANALVFHAPFAWAMRVTQATLAIAYAVSVAYYIKLLAEFILKAASVAFVREDGGGSVLGLILRLASVVLPLAAMRPCFSLGTIGTPTLVWGRLRGGISIALALSKSDVCTTIPAATYAVVKFAVIVQGGTISALMKRLTAAAGESLTPSNGAHAKH